MIPLYIAAIVVFVLFSAFFSATETAFSSLSKLRLKALEMSDSKKSQIVVKLCNNYDNFISTVLIGNNIVNIAATTLSTLLFAILIKDPTLSPTISTIVMTLVVLIFGEITPKSIAKRSPEYFAHLFSPLIIFFYYLLYPLTFLFGLWQKLISKLFKSKDSDKVTDEQLITLVDTAKEEGGLNEYERELITSAIEFDDQTIMDILTPRKDIVACSINMSMKTILNEFVKSGYSRIPIYKDNLDNIIGILTEKDFYREYIGGAKKINKGMLQDVIYASPWFKVSNVLRTLQKEKNHICIVVDDFGGTLGIVTLEDIIEELIGEIWDEHDDVVEEFVKVDENKYEVLGDTTLEDFFEYFNLDKNDEDFEPVNISGLIVTLLDRVAQVGDVIDFENLTITVKELDHHMISKIEVIVNPINQEEMEEK